MLFTDNELIIRKEMISHIREIMINARQNVATLYSGQDLQNNHDNSDMSLRNRLAFWRNGDKGQMLQIFATSGLFRENKLPDYWEGMAIKTIRDTASRFQAKAQAPLSNNPVGNSKRERGARIRKGD